jgi:hypothetical protein
MSGDVSARAGEATATSECKVAPAICPLSGRWIKGIEEIGADLATRSGDQSYDRSSSPGNLRRSPDLTARRHGRENLVVAHAADPHLWEAVVYLPLVLDGVYGDNDPAPVVPRPHFDEAPDPARTIGNGIRFWGEGYTSGLYSVIVHTGHLVGDAVTAFDLLGSPTRREVAHWLRSSLPAEACSSDMGERDEGYDVTTEDFEDEFDARFAAANERDDDLADLLTQYAAANPSYFRWLRA